MELKSCLSSFCTFLKGVGQCVGVVAVLVLGLIACGLLLCVALFPIYMLIIATEPSYSFILEYASVSLSNVTNDPLKMDLEWFLRFSVTNTYLVTNLKYQYINVAVDCLGENSTVAVIPPFEQKGGSRTHLNATVHTSLPRFNAACMTLPFNVHMRPKAKHRGWLYFYIPDYAVGKCRNMVIDIITSAGAMHGTMCGGPYHCPGRLLNRERLNP